MGNKLTKNLRPGLKVIITTGKFRGRTVEIAAVNRKKARITFKDEALQIQDFNKQPKSSEKVFKSRQVHLSNIKILEQAEAPEKVALKTKSATKSDKAKKNEVKDENKSESKVDLNETKQVENK